MKREKFLGLLGMCARAGNIVFGAQGCLTGIKKRQVKLLIIDSGASDNTKKEFQNKCRHNNVKCILWDGEPLSRRTGKSDNKLFGIKNHDFAVKLIEYYNNDTPGV